jgi:hypothetical protein
VVSGPVRGTEETLQPEDGPSPRTLNIHLPGVVANTCNPSTQEMEAGGLGVQSPLGYIARLPPKKSFPIINVHS